MAESLKAVGRNLLWNDAIVTTRIPWYLSGTRTLTRLPRYHGDPPKPPWSQFGSKTEPSPSPPRVCHEKRDEPSTCLGTHRSRSRGAFGRPRGHGKDPAVDARRVCIPVSPSALQGNLERGARSSACTFGVVFAL